MPVIVEALYDVAEIAGDLERLYADFPGRDAAACQAEIREGLASGAVFYAGTFNGRRVAGALVDGPAAARRIRLLAVRAATRRRGVAHHLLEEIARLERLAGSTALDIEAAVPGAIALLRRSGFAPRPDRSGLLRLPLSAG